MKLIVIIMAALAFSCFGAVELRPNEVEVVVDAKAAPFTRFAAEEMTNYLSRILGAEVPVVKKATFGRPVRIHLGDSSAARAAGVDLSGLSRDSYVIRAADDTIYIAGVDDPGFDIFREIDRKIGCGNILADYERGTLFGVYGFLEKYAGVRFIFPDDELGTIVPRKDVVRVPAGEERVTPDFLLRNPYFNGDGSWPDLNYGRGNPKTMLWLRLRLSSYIIPCCHGSRQFKYIERFGKTHPEYLALRRDGTRCLDPKADYAYKYCWSNPGLREELYQDVKAYLTGRPASSRGLESWGSNCRYRKYVDIMPDDGMDVGCFCEGCQAAYAKRGTDEPQSKYRQHFASGLIWGVAREIGERLIREGVGGNITTMVYLPYRDMPEYALPTNVQVMVAEGGPWSLAYPDKAAQEMEEIRAWARKVGHKVFIWTYPYKRWVTRSPGVASYGPHAWGRYYADLHDAIIGGFMECECDHSIYQFMNYYVFSHVMWDAKTDIDALLDEAYGLLFGAARPEMQAFFETLERLWTTKVVGRMVDTPVGPAVKRPDEMALWTAIYSPDVRKDLRRLLDTAAAKVAAGSLEARRIALMRREFFERLDAEAADFTERISVGRELAARAARPHAGEVLVGGDCTVPRADATRYGIIEKGKWLGGWIVRGKTVEVAVDTNCFVTADRSYRVSGRDATLLQYVIGYGAAPALKPSTRYRLSFFVKLRDVKSRGGGFMVRIWDDRNRYFPSDHSNPPGKPFAGATDWFHQGFVFTTGPETNRGKNLSYVDVGLDRAEGTFWVDGMRLEEWPEENDSGSGVKGDRPWCAK